MRVGSATTSEHGVINVTPLIDILLVLLIIFMVITPLTPRGMSANLPVTSKQTASLSEAQIVLEISRDGEFRLNNKVLSAEHLKSEISRIYSEGASKILFVRGDKNLEYREIAQVIDQIRGINPAIQVALLP